jgi:hypothetical protein
MGLFPSKKDIEDAEDHGQADLAALLAQAVADAHALLDRLNGAKLVFVAGGMELQVPPRKEAGSA